MAVYDRIGTTYAKTRRPDSRIEAAIRSALGGARSVVNVGAGSGSYEPSETVIAVEPSAVMIAQRPEGLAPAVQATAEAIPLADGSAGGGGPWHPPPRRRPSPSRSRTGPSTPPWPSSRSITGRAWRRGFRR